MLIGFNNNVPPPNYIGQQPMMPGQQPMPNLNQGKTFYYIKTKSSLFVNTHQCHAACVDMMEWAHGDKLQVVLPTHGAFVCSVSSGHCSGCHSVWTVATIPKSSAADVVKLREEFKLIVVDLT